MGGELSALAGPTVRPKGARSGFVGGPAGARRGSRPRCGPAPRPRGPPCPFGRGCPHPPRCAGLLRGSLRPSLPRLWRGPPSAFCALRPGSPAWRAAGRAPLVARGLARPARFAGGARPPRWLAPRAGLRSVGLPVRSPSSAPPVPLVLPLCGLGCSPFRGAPGAARGLPSRACSPAPLRPAGARAAFGPRLGSLRAPAGKTGLSGAGSFAPFRPAFLPFLPQWARRGGRARRPCGRRDGIQKVLRLGARTRDGETAQRSYPPALGLYRALPASLPTVGKQSVLLDIYA